MVARMNCLAALVILAMSSGTCLADVTLTVNQNGSAQYTTVQAAIGAVPANPAQRYIIQIAPGTYGMSDNLDQFKVTSSNVTLEGMGTGPSDVVLTGNYRISESPNDKYGHATAVVTGNDFVARNITFANTAGDNTGQALAMYAKADRISFDHCRFLGWQDTLRVEYGRQYFHDCYIEGDVDFIYGHATAFFENSSIYVKSNGYVTAPALLEPAGDYRSKGLVFSDCTIDGAAGNLAYLGRPWTDGGVVVYDDCKIGPVIDPAGWTGSSREFFAEHHSMDLNGNLLDVSHREAGSHQLTDAQALDYSRNNWLSGPDHWDPTAVPEPASAGLIGSCLLILGLKRNR